MATEFVDRAVLHVFAGDGGHGVASIRREKFKPLGGPDGGNGGRGGSVILRVDPQATTLLDYHRSPHRRASAGKPGGGDERNGADGDDLILAVPEGTVVFPNEPVVQVIAPILEAQLAETLSLQDAAIQYEYLGTPSSIQRFDLTRCGA